MYRELGVSRLIGVIAGFFSRSFFVRLKKECSRSEKTRRRLFTSLSPNLFKAATYLWSGLGTALAPPFAGSSRHSKALPRETDGLWVIDGEEPLEDPRVIPQKTNGILREGWTWCTEGFAFADRRQSFLLWIYQVERGLFLLLYWSHSPMIGSLKAKDQFLPFRWSRWLGYYALILKCSKTSSLKEAKEPMCLGWSLPSFFAGKKNEIQLKVKESGLDHWLLMEGFWTWIGLIKPIFQRIKYFLRALDLLSFRIDSHSLPSRLGPWDLLSYCPGSLHYFGGWVFPLFGSQTL